MGCSGQIHTCAHSFAQTHRHTSPDIHIYRCIIINVPVSSPHLEHHTSRMCVIINIHNHIQAHPVTIHTTHMLTSLASATIPSQSQATYSHPHMLTCSHAHMLTGVTITLTVIFTNPPTLQTFQNSHKHHTGISGLTTSGTNGARCTLHRLHIAHIKQHPIHAIQQRSR